MSKYFLRSREFWDIVRRATLENKEVLFMAYGCMDVVVLDKMSCGTREVIREPFIDYKAIARRSDDCFIADGGDERVLMGNDVIEIRNMVESMAEAGGMSEGYTMCSGDHIPFNVPPEAAKRFQDLSVELAHR